MKALLLAGGFGSRLKPYTEKIPKCLMPIGGRPLIDYWLEWLKAAGISQVLINTHHLHDQVEEYARCCLYSNEINLVYESKLKGTAGTLLANYKFWDQEESILVAHADNYCLADLREFQKAHINRPKNCHITMMTFITTTPSKCGVITKNNDGVVTDFYEKVSKPPSNMANGAIYIFSREALRTIYEKYQDAFDISLDLLPKFLGSIYAYETKSTLVDIGSIESYRYICNNLSKLK